VFDRKKTNGFVMPTRFNIKEILPSMRVSKFTQKGGTTMLRSLKSLIGFRLAATDDKIGKVRDFYFDDKVWTIRYLVAATGKWLPGKKVLLSPVALENPQWESKEFPIHLTKKQIESSPEILEDMPISKQKELEMAEFYDWPVYWPVGHTGLPPHVGVMERALDSEKTKGDGDPNLRSFKEVLSYFCHAKDGDIGHVEDIIVDDSAWSIRYVVIATGIFFGRRKVLVSPNWVQKIEWSEKKLHISETKMAIKNSPPYEPSEPINRKYEQALYDYYGRPVYWQELDKTPAHF
jgi:hypothetical protein